MDDKNEMDSKQVKACVDYINKNAAALHGVDAKKPDIGPDITPENVVSARVEDGNGILIVNRGIKGTPKYILSLDEVQKGTPPKSSGEAAEVEAKKVDALLARNR